MSAAERHATHPSSTSSPDLVKRARALIPLLAKHAGEAEHQPSRSIMMSGHGPGSRLHAGPLYRTPMMPILTLAATMPALGQAKTAL